MNIKTIPAAALFLACAFPLSSQAQQATSSQFTSSATISSTCTIRADNMHFGVIPPTGSVYAETSMYLKCSNDLPYSLILNADKPEGKKYMTGKPTNPDQILFSLCRNAYPCTSGILGNGHIIASEKGDGKENVRKLYATAKTDFYTPDEYTANLTLFLSY